MRIDEKTKITTSAGVLWAAVCFCITGTAIAAASYVNILHEIRNVRSDSVTHNEFQTWIDSFRESNPATKVPAVPRQHTEKGITAAVVARTETRTEH